MNGLIPTDFVRDLVAKSDIVEWIDRHINLKKAGQNYKACCPFHQEKTPSFVVSPHKQIFNCFGCGMKGNIISFIMSYDHKNFVEAVETLAQWHGVTIPRTQETFAAATQATPSLYELLNKIAQFYQQQLKRSQTAIQYLKQRGLTGAICKEFQIGYVPEAWDSVLKQFNSSANELVQLGMLIENDKGHRYDRFRNRIMFPIRDRQGRVIGFGGRVINPEDEPKYLNSPETSLFHKGEQLYGLYETLKHNRHVERIVVVEGYMDVIALAQYGITYTVATLGTSLTKQHVELLRRYTPEIILCFDGDEAGQRAAARALDIIFPVLRDDVKICFMFLPDNHDPDSLIRTHGTESFYQLMTNAKSLTDCFFDHLHQRVTPNSIENKARFAQLACQYLQKMPKIILKQMLIDELARLTRMTPERIQQLLIHGKTSESHGKTSERNFASLSDHSFPSTTNDPLLKQALSWLLQYPQEAKNLLMPEWLKQVPEFSLIQSILELIKTYPTISTAMILENFRDQPEIYEQLQTIDLQLEMPEAHHLQTEWDHLLMTLEKNHHEKQLDELMDKLSNHTITEEEKLLMQQLLQKIKRS